MGWKTKCALAALAFTLLGCAESNASGENSVTPYAVEQFGAAPDVVTGPLSPELAEAVNDAFVVSMREGAWGPEQSAALDTIVASGDARLVWPIADLMRFVTGRQLTVILSAASAELLKIEPPRQNQWALRSGPATQQRFCVCYAYVGGQVCCEQQPNPMV